MKLWDPLFCTSRPTISSAISKGNPGYFSKAI